MAFDLSLFVKQAREQGTPDEQIFNYLKDKNLIPPDILGNIGTEPSGQEMEREKNGPSISDSINDSFKPIAEFGLGAVKGLGSSIRGALKVGQDIGNIVTSNSPLGMIGEENKVISDEEPQFLKPEGTAQSIGFGAEKIAEYLIPGLLINKPVKAIKIASNLGKISPLKAAGEIAIAEGLGATAIGTAQTGSLSEGAKIGAATAGTVGVLSGIGQGLRKSGLSEKLYSQIFKNSADDMRSAIETGALKDMQVKFPDEFSRLVKSGVIKTGKGGEVVFDPTLAKEALDRGLSGSLRNMATETVRQKLQSEALARGLTENYSRQLKIPKKNLYVSLLNKISDKYSGSMLDDISKEASRYAKILNSSDSGVMPGRDVLDMRRFLDKMRIQSSYNQGATLGIEQAEFKRATDNLRPVINKIPGMEQVMDNYRFSLEALEAIAKTAQTKGNSAVINLIDTALFGFGGGLAGVSGAAAFPLARRAISAPVIATNLGSKINKGTVGNIGRAVRGAIIPRIIKF